MSAATVAVAIQFWQALDHGRTPGVLHEDIEVHDFDLPDAGVYHGHEGFARWLADWGEPWSEYGGDVQDILDLQDQVVSLMHLRARTADGLELEREDSQLFTVKRGRITKLEYFGTSEAALERAADPRRAATRKLVHDKIRGLYEAAAREDVEAVVAQLSPEYRFFPETDSPMEAAYQGHDGARRYFEEMFEAWQILEFRVERLVDAGDAVVALFEMRNRGRGSGIELTERWGEVWQTSGDQLVSSRFYTSHDQAAGDAGLM